MADAATQFSTLHEIVKAARENLAPEVWDYLIGGSETETTLKRNRMALDSLALRPRVLRDVSDIDATGMLLGKKMRLPVLLAPIGSLQQLEAGGGATAARAAGAFGIAGMLSSVCPPGLEAVADEPGEAKIFQLYVRGDEAWVDDHVRRAMDAGYYAFCLTVDLDHYGRRERDMAKGFLSAARQKSTGEEHQRRFDWEQVKRLRDTHDIPLILKGIATAEDAAMACENGIDAVYVSNHGGRQLDHGRGMVEVLPEVVAEVAGRAEIIVDGGILRGTDVVKAIALGAHAVGIGKLQGFGIAAAGQAGIVRVLELLEDEITSCLALLGVNRLADLDPSYLHPAPPVGPAHATSAFPLLDEGY